MKEDPEEPSSAAPPQNPSSTTQAQPGRDAPASFFNWLKNIGRSRNGAPVRDVLVEYIDRLEDGDPSSEDSFQERDILANILKVRDLTVLDVMIPRADIVAIDIDSSQEELLDLLGRKQLSRYPVYSDNLDDIVGSVHIKDIVATLAQGGRISLRDIMRDVPIVSPALPVLDLLHVLRGEKKHMALVIDEYGGIDGLVTIGDVLEALVGQIDDEHEVAKARIVERDDGTSLVDARLYIPEFEAHFGDILTEDEREYIDTVGGLVFSLAGRIPARGETIHHVPSGLSFEVLEADQRRVARVRVHKSP